MSRIILSFLFVLFLHIQNIFGINNSIVHIKYTFNKCYYIFRDTAGTRTFTPTSYFWDFGDGHTSTSQHAMHDYQANGFYLVKHIISDGLNNDTAIIGITTNCWCNFQLNANLLGPNIMPSNIQFEANYVGRPIRFFWDFGDGDTSNLENPYHEYKNNFLKEYELKFIIWDSTTSDTAIRKFFIGPDSACNRPQAAFTWKLDTICGQVEYTETCATTILYRYWDFGDGTINSKQKDPIHNYGNHNNIVYRPSLYVWDSFCRDSTYRLVTLICRDCYTTTANINLQVDPNDSSKAILYNNSTGVIKSHFWDFGDGTTSTLSSPTHTYTQPGNIRLKYVCTDTFNCKDSTYLFFEIDSNGHIKRGNITFTIQVVNNTNYTGLNELNEGDNSLKLYPQPASDFVQIESKDSPFTNIKIFGITGLLIYSSTLDENGQLKLPVEDWPGGMYVIQLGNGKIGRFVK